MSNILKFSGQSLAPGATLNVADVVGEWIMLVKTSGALSLMLDQASAGYTFSLGDLYREPFSAFTITNNSATDTILFSVWIGVGTPPQRLVPQERVTTMVAGVDVACGAGALTQVVTPGSNYTRTFISLPSTAAAAVRIGGSGTASNKGVLLQPGVQMTVNGTTALYCWNPNAASVTVSYSVETAS